MDALFKRLGLNRKEMETFLRLLELGAQPVSVIAKCVGVPRTSMYFLVEKLRQAQLIEQFERRGITYVRCIPVKSLPDVLKNREREIQQTLAILEDNLGALEDLENTASITPKVKFFEGKEEVMRMYAQIIQEPSFCAFVDLASVEKNLPEYHETIPQMLNEHGGRARELAVDSAAARRYRKKFLSPRHRIAFLPSAIRFTSDIIICPDRLYMTAYGEGTVAAIQIFGKTLAQTKQALFDHLWSLYGDEKRQPPEGSTPRHGRGT